MSNGTMMKDIKTLIESGEAFTTKQYQVLSLSGMVELGDEIKEVKRELKNVNTAAQTRVCKDMNACGLFKPAESQASIYTGKPGNCYDGVKNNGEFGIDCGGPCQACPNCYDGMQNQGEKGIDVVVRVMNVKKHLMFQQLVDGLQQLGLLSFGGSFFYWQE